MIITDGTGENKQDCMCYRDRLIVHDLLDVMVKAPVAGMTTFIVLLVRRAILIVKI